MPDNKYDDVIIALKVAALEAATDMEVAKKMVFRAADILKNMDPVTIDLKAKTSILSGIDNLIKVSLDSPRSTVNGRGKFHDAISQLLDAISAEKINAK